MTNTILSPLQMFFFCSESSAAFSLLYYRNHFCVKNWCRHSAWRDDRLLSVKQAPGSIKSFVLVEELLSSNSRLTFLQELSKCYRVLSGDGKQKGRRRRKKKAGEYVYYAQLQCGGKCVLEEQQCMVVK